MSHDEIIAYNLRENGTAFTIFADSQLFRVEKARELIEQAIDGEHQRIIELGCSAGDISGPFSDAHEVIGVDVVPGAVAAARLRYPAMTVMETEVESLEPQNCDVLVLCEFLEHVIDPVALVKAWLPLARNVVIGHPLVAHGHDNEIGHVWAYDRADYYDWYQIGGHEEIESSVFEMGAYQMIIGRGRRK